MTHLTAKELTALEDQMTQEQVLIKKFEMYARDCSDPQIKTQCEQMAAKHQNHYNTLLGQLG